MYTIKNMSYVTRRNLDFHLVSLQIMLNVRLLRYIIIRHTFKLARIKYYNIYLMRTYLFSWHTLKVFRKYFWVDKVYSILLSCLMSR